MAVPKKRTSRARRDKRRSQWMRKSTETINATKCPNCGTPVLPHNACPKCGTYRGRKVMDVEEE